MASGHRIVGQQLAPYVAEHGGASVYYATGRPVEGPGFMVSQYRDSEGQKTEKTLKTTQPTAEQLQDYADATAADYGPNTAMGVYVDKSTGRTVLDRSTKEPTVADMRRTGKREKQESGYALPRTPIGGLGTPEAIHRPDGAVVHLNLGSSPSKGDAPFIDMHANEADAILQQTDGLSTPRPVLFGRSQARVTSSAQVGDTGATSDWVPDQKHVSLKEVDSDAWQAGNHHNVPGASGTGPERVEDGGRIDIGHVYNTINQGRAAAARGIGMVADPEKGWHQDVNEEGQKVGPRKKRKDLPDVGERATPVYDDALEAERVGFNPRSGQWNRFPGREMTDAEIAEHEYGQAAFLHARLAPPRQSPPQEPMHDIPQMPVGKHRRDPGPRPRPPRG